MPSPSIAIVTVTPLAGLPNGLIAPASVVILLQIKRLSDGVYVDIANPEVRLGYPSGYFATVPITRSVQGTYVSGALVLNNPGLWKVQGHSTAVTDLVQPSVVTVSVTSDGFPLGTVPALPVTNSGNAGTYKLAITPAMLTAGLPVVVPTTFVPSAAIGSVVGGMGVNNLVSVDSVTAQITVAMNDGANPSPFVAGDVVILSAVQ